MALAAVVFTTRVVWPVVVLALRAILDVGVNEQVGRLATFNGVIAQLRATVPVNPPVPLRVMVVEPDWPRGTLMEIGRAHV